MTKKIKFEVALNPDENGRVDVGCFAQHDATVTLDGVEYKGAVICQEDNRPGANADFPGIPEDALEFVRWIPFSVAGAIYDASENPDHYDTNAADDETADVGFLRNEFQYEFEDAVDNSDEFDYADDYVQLG